MSFGRLKFAEWTSASKRLRCLSIAGLPDVLIFIIFLNFNFSDSPNTLSLLGFVSFISNFHFMAMRAISGSIYSLNLEMLVDMGTFLVLPPTFNLKKDQSYTRKLLLIIPIRLLIPIVMSMRTFAYIFFNWAPSP